MFFLCRRKFSKLRVVIVFVLAVVLLYCFRQTILLAGRDFLYLTRPIWDSANEPTNLITHYYAEGLQPETLCRLHNWTVRENPTPRVIDAFLFSNELDLLEIRMKELWEEVDSFVIVESNTTFTGKEKPLFFNLNRARFAWAAEKLVYFRLENLSTKPETAFENEAKTRRQMTTFIKSLKPQEGDLIIVGDLDELPYPHTIRLLKLCTGYPPVIHLELQNYRYSFEFQLQTLNWKPHIATYEHSKFHYYHGRDPSSPVLADAGWHCSFCFRHISDFVFKMTSYSHSDRVMSPQMLREENIQRKICEGADIFDMLPEVYSFKELVAQWGNDRKRKSAINIPNYILRNEDKFKYLLPGGCEREKES